MVRHLYRVFWLIAVALIMASCGKEATVEEYAIVPQPVALEMGDDNFVFSSSTRCYAENVGQNDPSVKYILRQLRQWHFGLPMAGTPEPGCLCLALNADYDSQLGDEGYRLTVGHDGIELRANTERGLFYAFQTFAQMLPEDVSDVSYSAVTLRGCTIVDYPRFEWRGCHLDVSRHFFDVREVKRYLDVMAAYKLNKFHWHLTDDHGWRIENSKYMNLIDIGAWHVDRDDQPWGEAEPPREGEPCNKGGYYTKEEIAEVVAYAAERYIDVVPEVDFPGHCCAVLEAYPEFACEGDDTTYTVQFGPYWPPRAILCGGNDSVMQFLRDVMDELIPLFPYEYIHVGGDEAWKENWRRCPRCQARIKELGLGDEEGLQSWMTREIEDYVKRQQKNIIGWDEILEGGVSKEATVMSWQGVKGGLEAARRGNKVIMCPTEFCYLNFYQANPDFQPPAMPNSLVTLHKVYQFDPMPQGLTEEQRQCILGGQCNLWAEYINTNDMVEYMLLPRMCAMAEDLWSPLTVKDWGSFRQRVAHQVARLQSLGYKVGSCSFKPMVSTSRTGDGQVQVSLDWEVEGTSLYWRTKEGKYQLYTEPFALPEGTTFYVVAFYRGKMMEQVYEFEG